MDFIRPIAKHVLEPIIAFREGSNHLAILRELEKSQYYPPGQIQELQLDRLKRLLLHAQQHCRFYTRRFANVGFDPARMQSPSDFEKVPYLTKSDIQNHRDQMTANNMRPDQLVRNQTGGSTGAPLRFYLDRERMFSRKASTMRHDRWAGWDIGRKMAVLWGYRPDFAPWKSLKAGVRATLLDRRLTFDTSDITPARLADFVRRLRRFKPAIYLAYANSMYLYARYLRQQNVRDYHRPRSIITSAELLTEEQRTLIEEVFECKVYDRYGCRETSVIASGCPEHSGLHIGSETLYVEFRRAIRASQPGEPGRIVITDLLNFGMPLIRYEIEDMGTPLSTSCACGRTLPLMRMAGGRTTDFLVSPHGRVVSGASLTIYFVAVVPGVAQAQLVQHKKDLLTIRIVRSDGFGPKSEQAVQAKVMEFFGPDMKHELEFVDNIPTEPSGKHRFSVSEIDPLEYLV